MCTEDRVRDKRTTGEYASGWTCGPDIGIARFVDETVVGLCCCHDCKPQLYRLSPHIRDCDLAQSEWSSGITPFRWDFCPEISIGEHILIMSLLSTDIRGGIRILIDVSVENEELLMLESYGYSIFETCVPH